MDLETMMKMKTSEVDKIIRKNFYINLNNILNDRKISHSDLAREIGISSTSKWAYQTDNTFPSAATLLKMSLFLNVTINDLLLPEEINTYIKDMRKKDSTIDSKLDSILLMLNKIMEENSK